MSLTEGFFSNIEDLLLWFGSVISQSVDSYCDIETADSKHVLVGKDGSLASVIQLDGYKRFVGATEFAFLSKRLTEIFQPFLSTPGHHFQFFFSHEHEGIVNDISQALDPARKTATRLGLDIEDIFAAREDILGSYCRVEKTYVVIWTTLESINSSHLKHIQKTHSESMRQVKIPKMKDAQNLFAVLPEIRNIHDSLVHTLLEDIQHVGYYAHLMDVHSLLAQTRQTIDPNFTSDSWKPFLPGDKVPVRYLYQSGKDDLSHLVWPNLTKQLFPREGENVTASVARIGDRMFAPLYIELFPKDIKPFYELFRRLLVSDLPWRISYYLSGEGLKITSSKNMLAQFLTVTSHFNRLLVDVHKMLANLHERSDNPVIKLTVCLSTWAPADDPGLLEARIAKLAKAVQSWGSCEVRDVSGDAFGTALSSTLALTKRPVAGASAAPLSEAVYMLPFVRPASPWMQGAMLFRTPDGKLWPYQPGSAHQVSWIDIVYARSGSGKSVLLNTLNLGLCLSPGLSKLPRVSIIDIGPSSKGFISLLSEGVAPEMRHQIRYLRVRLEEEHAINPFDTQLGARFPTKLHRSFLINFLSLLLVDNIEDKPFEGVASMLSMIVDETYKRYSESEQPKVYVPHAEPDVEEKMGLLGHHDLSGKSWWYVADELYAAGELTLSLIAQRQAMPTVSDTISIAHAHAIKDLFGHVQTPSGEDYVAYYCRVISSIIRNFPTLSCVTRINIEGARVVALDLDEVAKSGSAAADKQTAVMYMLARHVLSQHFFLHGDDVEKFPAHCKEYHKSRVKEIMEEPKRMVLDEFHRTSKSPVVREQIIQDMREGRKWKIHISLASQSLQDFDKLMIEFATSIFIMDSGSQMAVEQTCKTFGLSETEKTALLARVHGPTSEGATFIAQFVTKQGMNTQLLMSTISAVELWAFNTTTEDVFIRDTLYDRVGPKEARTLLAVQFPRGTASKEIEAEIKSDPALTIAEVCDHIVDELVMIHRRKMHDENIENIHEAFFDEQERLKVKEEV